MEFGMFHQFPVVPGGSETDAFAQAFDQVDAAERYGLDAMWLAELHVDPARSVLAAPMTIASAAAARTERIKIGIAVQVLPLCHPLRARSEPEPSIMKFFREQAARLRASANRAGTSASEGRTERAAMLDTLTYEDAIRGKIIIGTPERVAEQLHALKDELGLDGILAELNTGRLIPHDCVVNALRLLCEEVKPAFH
ncbi:MAG: LLM class flavin-dependent oxidoreductase [Stellaceae bacterium]